MESMEAGVRGIMNKMGDKVEIKNNRGISRDSADLMSGRSVERAAGGAQSRSRRQRDTWEYRGHTCRPNSLNQDLSPLWPLLYS